MMSEHDFSDWEFLFAAAVQSINNLFKLPRGLLSLSCEERQKLVCCLSGRLFSLVSSFLLCEELLAESERSNANSVCNLGWN